MTVTGPIAITASATDNVGVAGVQFLVDGQTYGSEITAAPYTTTLNTAALSNGSHNITARARDAAGNLATASAVAVTAANTTSGFKPIRVSAGGSAAYTDSLGQVWSADTGALNGSTSSTSASIAGTSDPTLYRSERYNSGTLQYQFTVPNGSYNVKLKFAEIYFGAANQRVFNIVLNGSTVLPNFDIVSAAGGSFKAVDKSFTVSASSGQIVIQLVSVVNNAKISAIEITPGTAAAIRVNAGGAAYTDSLGQVWTADTGAVNGSTSSTSASISGTSDPTLYKSDRFISGMLRPPSSAPTPTLFPYTTLSRSCAKRARGRRRGRHSRRRSRVMRRW
jgi:hypothetical protein